MDPSQVDNHGTEDLRGVSLKGAVLAASIRPVSENDAHEISGWYEPDPSGQPSYADDPKWKEWWCGVIVGSDKELSVFKLSIGNEIFGLLAVKAVVDWYDNRPTLYINGLRVHPSIAAKNATRNHYAGVGSALIEFAVALSLEKGLDGVGLNSSLGAEGFYRKLGLDEMPARDGKRIYFNLKGREKCEKFLAQLST